MKRGVIPLKGVGNTLPKGITDFLRSQALWCHCSCPSVCPRQQTGVQVGLLHTGKNICDCSFLGIHYSNRLQVLSILSSAQELPEPTYMLPLKVTGIKWPATISCKVHDHLISIVSFEIWPLLLTTSQSAHCHCCPYATLTPISKWCLLHLISAYCRVKFCPLHPGRSEILKTTNKSFSFLSSCQVHMTYAYVGNSYVTFPQ